MLPSRQESPGSSVETQGRSYRFHRLGSARQTPPEWTLLSESSTRMARAASSGTIAAGRMTSLTTLSSYATSSESPSYPAVVAPGAAGAPPTGRARWSWCCTLTSRGRGGRGRPHRAYRPPGGASSLLALGHRKVITLLLEVADTKRRH